MTATADAVVVGAGLNGAATAFFLLAQGLRRVAILDAGSPGSGASGDAAGLLRTHYDNRPETELAVCSMPWFREWDDRIGGDCGWIQTGFFRFIGRDELWKLEANAAVQIELGDEVEVLDGAAVRTIAPEFNIDDIGGAIFEPNSGTGDNALAVSTLLDRAKADGAVVKPFTRVLEVELAGDRVAGVRTSEGAIATPIVVIAAGIGSRALGATCGVDLPCESRPISAAEIRPADGLPAPASYMDPLTDSWITPRGGRIVIPAVNGTPGDGLRSAPLAAINRVSRRVPSLAQSTVIRTWSRPDAYAPDGKPIIGAARGVEGLFFNTASAGKGHKVAPAAALGLSELIVAGAARTVDLAPFGVKRFDEPLAPWSKTEYLQRTIG